MKFEDLIERESKKIPYNVTHPYIPIMHVIDKKYKNELHGKPPETVAPSEKSEALETRLETPVALIQKSIPRCSKPVSRTGGELTVIVSV